MRRLGVIAVLVMLASALGASIAVAAANSPFVGSWTSIDPVDGSTQHLTIRGGTNLQVQYVDEYGTTCVDIGANTTVFTGVMTGRVIGNELDALFKRAGCGSQVVLRASDGFVWIIQYDPNTDTLFGAVNDGPATWYRD